MHDTDNTCSSSSVESKILGEGKGEGMAHVTGLDVVAKTDTPQKQIKMILQLNLLKSCFTVSI